MIVGMMTAAMAAGLAATAQAADPDWAAIGKALGKEGTVQPDGVYRIGLPRSDLKVTLDGVSLKPAFALGGWLAFEPAGAGALVMGDLVLLESEVNPVMQRLEQSGIEITAVHNHLLRSKPATMYMHVMGQGDPVELAKELHDGLSLSKTPLEAPSATGSTSKVDLDAAAIDKIMGTEGKANGAVLQYSLPRAEQIVEHGMPIPPALGTAIAINFQSTGTGKAAITGDFVLIGSEVTPVLKALRENGIEVTALHSHMIDEEPRLYFMHFWAKDDAQKLARGLKAALDLVNSKKT
jgi:biotin operon repressor